MYTLFLSPIKIKTAEKLFFLKYFFSIQKYKKYNSLYCKELAQQTSRFTICFNTKKALIEANPNEGD